MRNCYLKFSLIKNAKICRELQIPWIRIRWYSDSLYSDLINKYFKEDDSLWFYNHNSPILIYNLN